MDTRTGEFLEPDEANRREESDLAYFDIGEVFQIKEGWFEVVGVSVAEQIMTVKPIPRPGATISQEEIARMVRDGG